MLPIPCPAGALQISGWHKYETISTSNEPYTVVVPPDVKYEMKEGDNLSVYVGRNGNYIIDKYNLPGSEQQQANGVNTTASNGDYVSKVRDPQIASQKWCQMTLDFYKSCLPYIKDVELENEEQVDEWIDAAFTKGLELQERITSHIKKLESSSD